MFLFSFLKLLIYFIICASCALFIRIFTKIPDEIYRKTLHFILIGSAPVFLYIFDTWYSSAIASLFFAILVYPALSLAENLKEYSNILAERDSGEIKRSLLYVFGMFSAVIAISWGIIGEKYIALTVILGWGFGDAAAALVGKKYGKRYLQGKFIDGKKTLEGTVAMFIVSFIAIFLVLFLNIKLPWYRHITVALITAMVGSIVELNTKNGFDTITCPTATLLVMLPLLYLWGDLL